VSEDVDNFEGKKGKKKEGRVERASRKGEW
jgi:hypothetical protein